MFLFQDACGIERIGPNAAQWYSDEAQFKAGLVPGKEEKAAAAAAATAAAAAEDGVENATVKKQKKKQPPKKVIPIPYRRYVLENNPFREVLYSYKHKQNELRRKRILLKKQQKSTEPADKEAIVVTQAAIDELTKTQDAMVQPLKITPLAICSFVVRLTMSPREFPVKWAEDIAHVFGLQFSPVRDPPTGK